MENKIIIKNNEGILTVSSLQVAKDFEKNHRHVTEAISTLIEGCAEKSADLFIEGSYQHPQNKQWYKYYEITRDGFSLLVMGFTGKKALEWKLKYIEAFNLMEHQLLAVNRKANLLLEIYNGGTEAVIASRHLVEIETQPFKDQIEKDKPMVEFAEHIRRSDDSIDMKEMAKFASKNGIKIGRNNLLKFLRENNVIMKNNEPYQKYINNGWLEFTESTVVLPDGRIKITKKPLVKSKGQIGIVNMLKKYCA